MPARTFVLIFKCVARPNLCETPALVKPPPRYRQVGRTVQADTAENKVEKIVLFDRLEENLKYKQT